MIISDNLKLYVQKLRSSNLRPTKQRLKICQFLFDREKTFHFTVESLNKKINKNKDTKLSLATIYNTVEAFTNAGGNSIYCGKPHKQIYNLAYSKLKKHNIKCPKILCIGDGINTDILGGKKEKLDTLFICGGLSGPELGMKNNLEIPNEKKLEELFEKNKNSLVESFGF